MYEPTFSIQRSPERGGDSLQGGGKPSEIKLSERDEIAEMTGHAIGGHGNTPGVGDLGKPGSDPAPETSASESDDPTAPRIAPDSPPAQGTDPDHS